MGPTTPFNPSDLIGTTIGGCRIEKLLGQGGMGIVFLAHHSALDIPVAVKLLLPNPLTGPQGKERFMREARAAARCRHPNIVGVLNTGEDNGFQFIIMEYVKGGSLRSLIDQNGALPVSDAVEITRQILLALECAAEYHIVHRDVKPDNILIDEKGVIKLADLGLARIIGSDLSLTQSDRAVGSPYYIAPEQASDPRSVDHRADIYSLGCVLYHLLSGVPPFGGATDIEVILKHVSTPAPELRDTRRDVPEELCAIVKRMMAKEPGDRFQTPEEVRRALEPFSASVNSPSLGGLKRPGRRRRAFPWIIAFVATGAIAIAGIALVAFWMLRDREEAPPTPVPAIDTTQAAPRTARTIPPRKQTPRSPRARSNKPGPGTSSRALTSVDPLVYAVLKGDHDKLNELLNKGANPNRPDGTWTPLHEAVLRGSMGSVTALLQKGASPNTRDDRGDVPLHYAIRMHRTDMAGALLDYGANPNLRDRNGKTPLEMAANVRAEAIGRKLREKGGN